MRKRDSHLFGRQGRYLEIIALISIACLISGLLLANYRAQHSLQETRIARFQGNLEDRARSLNYFLSEREHDLRDLAVSPAVRGYFENRALGMTMTYGLRASLNSIDRTFALLAGTSLIGGQNVYTGLALLDTTGQVLSSWPKEDAAGRQPVPSGDADGGLPAVMHTGAGGTVILTSPVSQNERLVGFVRSTIALAAVTDNLMRDLVGRLAISAGDEVVFASQQGGAFPRELVTHVAASAPSPVRLDHDAETSPGLPQSHRDPAILYHAGLADFGMRLFIIEDLAGNDGGLTHQVLIMGTLGLLSLAVFLVATFLLRASSRNLVLQTSLSESAKRERIVADKNRELQLILQGAGLGTWKWNIASGEYVPSERSLEIGGYRQGEIPFTVSAWESLIHPDDVGKAREAMRRHLAGEIPLFTSEHRIRHKDGRWKWVFDAGQVLKKDGDGTPLRAFGIRMDITRRMEAIEQLAKARRESDEIIRTFLDTMIVVNNELTVVRVNQATCELLGYNEDSLIGQPVANLFHTSPDTLLPIFSFNSPEHRGLFGDAPELRNIELDYRDASGSRLTMSFNISPLRNDRGEVSGVVAGAKDISKLRQAFDQIARQKEFIETLFEIMPVGLFTVDAAGRIATCNQTCREMVTRWAVPLAVDDQGFADVLTSRIGENTGDDTIAIPIPGRNTSAYFRCSSTEISLLEGVARVVTIIDITHERKTQEEIHLLATVVEQIGESVIVTGTDEVIRYVNTALQNNSGFSREEVLGRTPVIFGSEDLDGDVFQEMRARMAQGQAWSGRLRSRKKNGEIYEVDATVSPVRNEEGRLTHFVAITRDITEMALLQRRLLQAQKLEAIGQLAAGIAHEINTPMQYIQNNVTFFEQSFEELGGLLTAANTLQQRGEAGLPAELAEAVGDVDFDYLLEEVPASIAEVKEGIGRVVKIVAAMKEFSHPGSEVKVATDLSRTLESTVTVCRNEWKYVAEMVTDYQPEMPLVPCYPDELNQAVLNLIINASHAIDDAGRQDPSRLPGRIAVSTSMAGDMAEIRVSDTGMGIPEEIQARIFDPFFTTKEVGKGTGQGLTIVYDVVVSKHGGSITFETTSGKGTTFIIHLPMSEQGDA